MESPQSWPLPEAAALRDELAAAYAGPGRHYHGTRHLQEVLSRLDELARAGTEYDDLPVRLAAWFHDALYDGERDSEERGAAWAEDSLPAYLDRATVAEVARLIRLTESHQPAEHDGNGAALSDADLGILAAEPERYDDYTEAVRREYAYLGDEEFRIGRAQVLLNLLNRDPLFHSEHGRRVWQELARANLQRELDRLG